MPSIIEPEIDAIASTLSMPASARLLALGKATMSLLELVTIESAIPPICGPTCTSADSQLDEAFSPAPQEPPPVSTCSVPVTLPSASYVATCFVSGTHSITPRSICISCQARFFKAPVKAVAMLPLSCIIELTLRLNACPIT